MQSVIERVIKGGDSVCWGHTHTCTVLHPSNVTPAAVNMIIQILPGVIKSNQYKSYIQEMIAQKPKD